MDNSYEWLDTVENHDEWGVRVAPSQLLNKKELGLYATRTFQPNEPLVPYLGEELTADQRKERYGDRWGPYIYFKPWGHPSIDAQFYRGAAAFANDGTWIPSEKGPELKKRKPDLSNVYLKRGWLRAKKRIREGQEILLDYGDGYWKRRFQGKPLRGSWKPKLVKVDSEPLGELGQVGGGRPEAEVEPIDKFLYDLTPVESQGQYWLKRDDLFEVWGVSGGKVRTCLSYILDHMDSNDSGTDKDGEQAGGAREQVGGGIKGVVTGGSRSSPQVQIVGHLATGLGLSARLHLPKGELPPYIQEATLEQGHEVFQWFPGFNHVLSARARDDANNLNRNLDVEEGTWLEVPFGMEVPQAVAGTARQVENLPFENPEFKRVVVPVGSGMTLAGILTGLRDVGISPQSLPVLGVVVGQDPAKRLDKWAPSDWRDRVELVRSSQDYHKKAPTADLQIGGGSCGGSGGSGGRSGRGGGSGGVALDPIYEAKAVPFLRPGDLLWIVGHR